MFEFKTLGEGRGRRAINMLHSLTSTQISPLVAVSGAQKLERMGRRKGEMEVEGGE